LIYGFLHRAGKLPRSFEEQHAIPILRISGEYPELSGHIVILELYYLGTAASMPLLL
jgi:hypothetical protein